MLLSCLTQTSEIAAGLSSRLRDGEGATGQPSDGSKETLRSLYFSLIDGIVSEMENRLSERNSELAAALQAIYSNNSKIIFERLYAVRHAERGGRKGHRPGARRHRGALGSELSR